MEEGEEGKLKIEKNEKRLNIKKENEWIKHEMSNMIKKRDGRETQTDTLTDS